MCLKEKYLELFDKHLHIQSDFKETMMILFQAPSGGEGYPPYGPGAGAWGSYDPQRAPGSR